MEYSVEFKDVKDPVIFEARCFKECIGKAVTHALDNGIRFAINLIEDEKGNVITDISIGYTFWPLEKKK